MLAARMVAAAIRESMFVYMDWMKPPETPNDVNTPHDDSDNDDSNSNLNTDSNTDSNAPNSVPFSDPDTFSDSDSDTSASVNTLSSDEWHRLVTDDPLPPDSDISLHMSPPVQDSESDVLSNSGTSPLWAHGRVTETASLSDEETVQHSSSST